MKVRGMGVVGAGIMGQRMIGALQQHPRWRVAAVWDPRGVPAGLRAATGLQALVEAAGVDAVYVASPPAAHLEGVQAALAAGRAVLCEKPLASELASARALHHAVAAAGLPFAVNFPFAASPATNRLGAIVKSGELGATLQVLIRARFAQWPRPWQAGAAEWLAGPAEGGFAREVLSHFVFLAQRLFGPAQVLKVELDRAPGRTETRLMAQLDLGGVPLVIDAAVGGDIADDNRFEVRGSSATVAIAQWSRLEWQGALHDRVDGSPSTLDGFARLLDGERDTGLATAAEALAVVETIETLLAG